MLWRCPRYCNTDSLNAYVVWAMPTIASGLPVPITNVIIFTHVERMGLGLLEGKKVAFIKISYQKTNYY